MSDCVTLILCEAQSEWIACYARASDTHLILLSIHLNDLWKVWVFVSLA